MGRLVLIEFDDNEMTEAFLKASDLPQLFEFRVVGTFIKPASLCECFPREEKSFHGAKFGLFACKKCRKVKPLGAQYLYDINKRHVLAKHRQLFIGCRFKMEDGKVVTAVDE
jgi:hypothetical protein